MTGFVFKKCTVLLLLANLAKFKLIDLLFCNDLCITKHICDQFSLTC
jgi:hypothetical protein